jgi:hypothetical protein
MDAGAQWMAEYASFSLLLPLVLVAAAVSAAAMAKRAPKWEVPESPMAKYRREAPIEELTTSLWFSGAHLGHSQQAGSGRQ